MNEVFDPSSFTRHVSNDAYNLAINTGLIKKLRRKVFDYVWTNGPCTQSMAVRDLAQAKMILNSGVVSTRFSELVKMKAIRILGKALDPVNKQMNVTWYDVTGKVPIKLNKDTTTFWVLFSEKSGRIGYASRDRSDVEQLHASWIKDPEYSDAEIIKTRVVKVKPKSAHVAQKKRHQLEGLDSAGAIPVVSTNFTNGSSRNRPPGQGSSRNRTAL